MEETKALKKAELKKHIAAVHVNNKLTLLQRKIANILLVNAYDDLLTKDTHTIKTNQLAFVAGYDSHDHETLKVALAGLAETTLQWNILKESGGEEWGVSTMLAQAVIERGVCRYAYSPALRKKLYSPEMYARIHLAIQRKFTSGHALALYENCVRFRGVGSTGWWSIGILRALLGVQEDEYGQFKDLNKWVIKPAVKQINASSDLAIEPEFKRERRRIATVRFQVKDSPWMQMRFPLLHSMTPEQTLASEIKETEAARLQQFGFSGTKAKAAVKRYGDDYVNQNLDIVERDYQAGKVANLPAYTAAALRDDYREKLSPMEEEQAEKTQISRAAELCRQEKTRHAAQREQLRREFDKRRLEHALEVLSSAERKALEARFEAAHKTNLIFRKWFMEGYEHPVMQSLFRSFASQALLDECKESEFTAFLEARGREA